MNGLLSLALQGADQNFWFPEQASTVAGGIDAVFYFILWVSTISFVGVVGVTLWFAWKYRARPGHSAVKTSSHDNTLEVTWTILPTILVAGMFWVGFKGFLDLRNAPEGSYQVNVTAQKWSWDFQYPNGHTSPELHGWVGQPTRLLMSSTDVLHSLYLPSFRVKQDIVPGRYTSLWYEATKPGVYNLFCTEYCGDEHSSMITTCVIHESKEAFDAWMEVDSDIIGNAGSLVEAGEILYRRKGCTQCHLPTAETVQGPGFLVASEAWRDGTELPLDGGGSVIPDENYLRESILVPGAQIRDGFKGVNMPAYQGRIKDDELGAIILYIQSLALEGN